MKRSLVVEQHVAADPARVYAAWTSAAGLAAWWWPQIPDTTYVVDARVGGSYDIRSQAAGIGVRGEFVRLDEPHEIGMTWHWMNDGVSAVDEMVWVHFIGVDLGTLVRVTHELAEIAGDGADQRQGWSDVLVRLAETAQQAKERR